MSEVKLYLGDCLDVMKGMESGSVDLTVTSPPYDNLRSYNGYVFDFNGIADQLYRVTKPGGVVVWVVGDATINGSETGTSFRQALYFMQIGFNLHDTMIYDKDHTACYDPRNKRYKHRFEYMFIFSKETPKTYNPITDVPVISKGIQKSKSSRKPDGTMRKFPPIETKIMQARGNIWRFDNGYMKSTSDLYSYSHPAIFPEALARDHILSWSNPGDTVLDPMCGSGTTGKMAVLNQRDFIGIDISAEYIAIAEKRIKEAQMQPLLFEETK